MLCYRNILTNMTCLLRSSSRSKSLSAYIPNYKRRPCSCRRKRFRICVDNRRMLIPYTRLRPEYIPHRRSSRNSRFVLREHSNRCMFRWKAKCILNSRIRPENTPKDSFGMFRSLCRSLDIVKNMFLPIRRFLLRATAAYQRCTSKFFRAPV